MDIFDMCSQSDHGKDVYMEVRGRLAYPDPQAESGTR